MKEILQGKGMLQEANTTNKYEGNLTVEEFERFMQDVNQGMIGQSKREKEELKRAVRWIK